MPDCTGDYLQSIERAAVTGQATEHTHRPALKKLIECSLPGVIATNEPKRAACGAPDFSVARGGLTIGYVEAKDVGSSLDDAERSDQLKRYRSLPNLVLTDYLEFRWYVDGELRETARMGRMHSDGRIARDASGRAAALELIRKFIEHTPQPIATPLDLARRMAVITHEIRSIIATAFASSLASTLLHDLRKSFADTLLPDLDKPENVDTFADMYAQTLSYGLFAARCNHQGPPGSFQRLGAAAEIPKTNPFLRQLFEIITGTQLNDEPYAGYVDDLVQLLAHADINAILAEFGKRTRQEDPIVHFYETFLATYDPKLREKRGVYYTPEPVVSYITRSVDFLLRERFGLAGGLADTSRVTYEDNTAAPPRAEQAPRVLILDPACGTGTFLYSVVDLIREQFKAERNAGQWSGFVKDHLLPRLFGFELLMAPYAVAHLKLGLQLAGHDLTPEQQAIWAYDFSGKDRLGVYLTNTLEEAEHKVQTLYGPLRVISDEANAAARIKRDMPILVVMGNPPYSGHSANRSWETRNGERVPTFIGKLVRDYYFVDGKPLGERNPKWLQDDYVKFIRWAQWRIERSGAGILAFITNHSYLDNPTFRGMRRQLMKVFSDIYIVDLHGHAMKREKTPDGSADENVFDIQQGVAIGIFVKRPGKHRTASVRHAELWGSRQSKYNALRERDIHSTGWRALKPRSPYFLFVPWSRDLEDEYRQFPKITEVMPVNSVGIVTARDHLTIAWSKDEIWNRVCEFSRLPEEQARMKFDLGDDVRDWKVALAQEDVRSSGRNKSRCVPILYRPFDIRFTYYTGKTRGFMCMPRPEVSRHMLDSNVALVYMRQVAVHGGYNHFGVSRHMVDNRAFYSTRGNPSLASLYLYPNPKTNGDLFSNGRSRHVNLKAEFIAEIEKRLKLRFIDDPAGDLASAFGPEDVFNYIYAIFHSPTYRERYAQFLKIDFPRVPLTSDPALFRTLCALGGQLVALHLLESPALDRPITNFPVGGINRVDKTYPRYFAPGDRAPGTGEPIEAGRVCINPEQYFNNVPPDVWHFTVGGYQVCDKWLKDRRERSLTYDEASHYMKIVKALSETLRLMAEIDQAIPQWPIE